MMKMDFKKVKATAAELEEAVIAECDAFYDGRPYVVITTAAKKIKANRRGPGGWMVEAHGSDDPADYPDKDKAVSEGLTIVKNTLTDTAPARGDDGTCNDPNCGCHNTGVLGAAARQIIEAVRQGRSSSTAGNPPWDANENFKAFVLQGGRLTPVEG